MTAPVLLELAGMAPADCLRVARFLADDTEFDLLAAPPPAGLDEVALLTAPFTRANADD